MMLMNCEFVAVALICSHLVSVEDKVSESKVRYLDMTDAPALGRVAEEPAPYGKKENRI